MRFGHSCTGLALNLPGLEKAVLAAILTKEFLNVQAWRAYDVHVYRQSSGSIQMKHKGRTSFENEGTDRPDKGFQQRESADGLLYKGSIEDIHDGKVTLVYEKWVAEGHKWPGVGPVLMQGRVDTDLTDPANWKFSELYNPDEDMEASRPSGIPVVKEGQPGLLETNVVRVFDENNPFYDPTGKSVVLMMRANTGFPDIGVMMKGVEKEDGSLAVEKLHYKDGDMYFAHIPGADLKFYVCYDPESRLYWLLHSQIDGRMSGRRRLALSFSPNLIHWVFAGLVAVGPADNASRHYATMMISGDDLLIVSRSGDERARTAHDGDLVTFHRVKDFRRLIY